MKRIVQLAIVMLVFSAWSSVSYACWSHSCYCFKPDFRDGYKQAKAVFLGEVLDIIPPRSTELNAQYIDAAHTIRFRVETAWKGPFWAEANVLTRMDGCSGFSKLPEKGEWYLVYAVPVYPNDPSRSEVMTGSCRRTALLSEFTPVTSIFYHNQAAEDVRMLNNLMIMYGPWWKPAPIARGVFKTVN